MFKSIFVLESTWNRDDALVNTSIMPFVSEFSKHRNIKVYHQYFTDSKSFCHWIAKFNEICKKDALLYIASHGNKASIDALHGHIKKKTILDAIKKGKRIKYLHFGACLFGSYDNLYEILNNAKHLKWAAGYNKSVDWVESSLFDLLFWSRITPSGRLDEYKSKKTQTIVRNMTNTNSNGLVHDLGFEFLYRYGKKIF
jgi:hypothetical protein